MEILLKIDWESVFVPTSSIGEIVLRGTFVYLLLMGSAAFTMWSVAQQPFRVPVVSTSDKGVVAQASTTAPQRA